MDGGSGRCLRQGDLRGPLSSMVLGALSMEFHSGTQPQEVLNRVNRLLCEKSLPFQFVTLFLFLLDPHGTGQFISAGHNPAYCSAPPREKSRSWSPTPSSWGCSIPPLMNPAPSVSIEETFWWCIPTASPTRKTSGKKCSERTRLKDIIRQEAPLGSHALERKFLKAIEEFTQGMPQTDDITFVVVEKCQ
jgi:hypothetical protein